MCFYVNVTSKMYLFRKLYCIYVLVMKYIMLLQWQLALCTVDLNLPELQYLADHLHPDECRFLVASLHFKSYEAPNALEQAEEKVSKDIPCLRLLLHWNSAKGEGRGETHELIQHRLRQIGRKDLADWLGKTVFHELGEEMKHSLEDPFGNIVNETEKNTSQQAYPLSIGVSWDPTEWLAFDTILWVFLVGLTLFTLGVLIRVVCMLCTKKKRRKQKKKKFQDKHYNELENDCETDTSGSEDRFDIRAHNEEFIRMHKLPRQT